MMEIYIGVLEGRLNIRGTDIPPPPIRVASLIVLLGQTAAAAVRQQGEVLAALLRLGWRGAFNPRVLLRQP